MCVHPLRCCPATLWASSPPRVCRVSSPQHVSWASCLHHVCPDHFAATVLLMCVPVHFAATILPHVHPTHFAATLPASRASSPPRVCHRLDARDHVSWASCLHRVHPAHFAAAVLPASCEACLKCALCESQRPKETVGICIELYYSLRSNTSLDMSSRAQFLAASIISAGNVRCP